MRGLLTMLLVSGMALGQAADTAKPADTALRPRLRLRRMRRRRQPDPNATVIPAGTKIPLLLKQAISTKNAREGDAVYAETAFPFVVNDRILIPAGTTSRGRSCIRSTRGGRRSGRRC